MIVTRSFAIDPRMQAGTEVLTLNGVPVAEILARRMCLARPSLAWCAAAQSRAT